MSSAWAALVQDSLQHLGGKRRRGTHHGGDHQRVVRVADRHRGQRLSGTRVVPFSQAVGQLHADLRIGVSRQFQHGQLQSWLVVQQRFRNANGMLANARVSVVDRRQENLRIGRGQSVQRTQGREASLGMWAVDDELTKWRDREGIPTFESITAGPDRASDRSDYPVSAPAPS